MCDVAIHRIDQLETDELGPGGHAFEQAREIRGVVVAEDVLLGAAVADAGDHRGVIEGIGEHHHTRQLTRQGRQRRIIGDIAGGEDQRRLAAVQIGKFALEQQMHMVVAGDVADSAGAGADRPQRLFHRRQHRRVLAHAEIVVGAPDGDLCPDPMIEGARKAAAAPLEIGQDAIPSLGTQRVEALFEKGLVIYAGRCWLPSLRRRVSAGLLTRGGCGEVVDRALHPIALPTGPHRRHRVVVGGVRFQRLQANPENRLRVAAVEPDMRFRRLAQIVGVRPVVCDRPMIVIPGRVGGGPSDDGEVVVGSFEPWAL
jgi:hypothetical protein